MGCTPTYLGVFRYFSGHSQKHQTLNKVYFPFCKCLEPVPLLYWSRQARGGEQGWAQLAQVSSSLTLGVQFYKDFPPKGVCET